MRPALLNNRSTGAEDESVVLYLMKVFVKESAESCTWQQ
jgi:hypothetical protein